MVQVARTVGGPGAGKTHAALQVLEQVLEKVVSDPFMVGFCSFTRAARREASTRAGARFGAAPADLEKNGWFKTLHAIAYKQLAVSDGELLAGGKGDDDWLRNALGDPSARLSQRDGDDDLLRLCADHSPPGKALALWDAARNRLRPLASAWAAAAEADDRLPPLEECEATASAYEAAKRRDGRLDFCDLLLNYAGKRFTADHSRPFEDCEPRGAVYHLPVWFLDEAQDCSLLISLVFRRLTAHSQFAYLSGDFLQSIYSFAGADGSIFADWPVAKEKELPLSYRCGQKILDHSLRAVAGMPRAASRAAFRSNKGPASGAVLHAPCEAALAAVDPAVDTLVLARSNETAQWAARALDDLRVPWKAAKGGGGGPDAPARAAGVAAIVALRKGKSIDGEAVRRMLELLPSKVPGGEQLWERGTKRWFADAANRKELLPVALGLLDCVGATEACKNLIASGAYAELLEPPARRLAAAAERHGVEAVLDPKVRVGTIHSSKGQEAERVVLINHLPYPALCSMETAAGMDEERRVWYTGVTRAAEVLTIASTDGDGFPGL